MLITILAGGSRGDTQPYIALGLALKQRGCDVRLATHENFESFVRGYGLDFHPIRGDVTTVASGEMGRSAAQADNPLKVLLSFNKLKALVFDLQKDFFDACAGSDAIVYHPGISIDQARIHFCLPFNPYIINSPNSSTRFGRRAYCLWNSALGKTSINTAK